MHFDNGRFDRRDGVADGHGGMRITAGVEDNAIVTETHTLDLFTSSPHCSGNGYLPGWRIDCGVMQIGIE